MPSPTRQDVMAEIERQFTGSDRTTALKTLNLFTGKPGEREQVQLAILAQSYRYIFYVAIGIIPVLTLGGAIPVAIAAGGISACRQIATDARQPHLNRLLLCLGITVVCWAALFALVGGVAFLRSRG